MRVLSRSGSSFRGGRLCTWNVLDDGKVSVLTVSVMTNATLTHDRSTRDTAFPPGALNCGCLHLGPLPRTVAALVGGQVPRGATPVPGLGTLAWSYRPTAHDSSIDVVVHQALVSVDLITPGVPTKVEIGAVQAIARRVVARVPSSWG
jgi:hypothetical protein